MTRRVRDGAVIGAVAIGGAAGAAARYGLGLAWPDSSTAFPWTTFAINVGGCLAIGLLLAALERLTAPHRLVRPLIGTGFLGGFTTFSTYAEQTRALLAAGRWPVAAAYVLATLIAALVAVRLGIMIAVVVGRRPPWGRRHYD
jgi:CrcB protein